MYFELCLPVMLFGCLGSVAAWLITDELKGNGSNNTWIARTLAIVATVVMLIGIGGSILYGIADSKIEKELFVPVSTVDCVQYIQYDHPDQNIPIVINVNELFARTFSKDDKVKIIIYKDGPYNGMYCRPGEKISLLDK